jgi:bacterial/archaeal transporter family protein
MSFPALPLWLVLAVLALLCWGITGITQKLSTNRISSELSLLWFVYAMIAISVMLALTVPINWHVTPKIFWLAVIGGTLNGAGVLTSFIALESGGKASIVISLISLFPLPTVAFAILVLHERLTTNQAIGVVFALAAAILLSQEPGPLPADRLETLRK